MPATVVPNHHVRGGPGLSFWLAPQPFSLRAPRTVGPLARVPTYTNFLAHVQANHVR
jgi:hypothetical protein